MKLTVIFASAEFHSDPVPISMSILLPYNRLYNVLGELQLIPEVKGPITVFKSDLQTLVGFVLEGLQCLSQVMEPLRQRLKLCVCCNLFSTGSYCAREKVKCTCLLLPGLIDRISPKFCATLYFLNAEGFISKQVTLLQSS